MQALNILEGFDLKTMGHNTPDYVHILYQALNLAFADRDFYYGDPEFSPSPPIEGLFSKTYAAGRRRLIQPDTNNPRLGPGDPYVYQGGRHPFRHHLEAVGQNDDGSARPEGLGQRQVFPGTTSIQAADAAGWVVSLTPSGGWPPAFIAGTTGVGMSQRMQSLFWIPR